MAETTHISWADATFNPWIGCMKVSPACDGCYAEQLMAVRHKRVQWGAPGIGTGTRSRTSFGNWRKPIGWNRQAEAHGEHPFVFCASLADVFDSDVPPEWRRDLFDLIRATPALVWLLLTKRPGNIVKLTEEATRWPVNAAMGCTVVTQAEADRDIPKLLAAKADLEPAFAFLSMEPLMGPVSLRWMAGFNYNEALKSGSVNEYDGLRQLDWIITGGETDQGSHKARPSHTDWFRQVRDQCAAAGVAYHHKQNGEWGPRDEPDGGPMPVFRVGKRAAGRTLDGVIHDARPGASA